MKTFKQFFYENREYQVDDSQQEEYLEYQSEFVYDYEAMMGLPHDKLASIITKTGNKRFSATIDGVDPSVDGTEHYYVVTDRDVLKNIASLIASTGEPHHEEFAMDVGTGDSFEFMVRLPKSGFTGEEIGDMEVFLVAPGGSDQLHALLSQVRENFKDGKKEGKSRPGRVKRAGASCNGSVASLRKRAKNSGGEKGKMYHWCANMKGGKKKK